jgi:hypothetical protein
MAQDKAINVEQLNAALGMEQRLLAERYLLTVRRAKDLIDKMLEKSDNCIEPSKASTHDGFNLGGIASDLQTLAGQLGQINNVIELAKAAR